MKKVLFLFISLIVLLAAKVSAQPNVFDPNDPVTTYDPARPPATPPPNTLAKWVRTKVVDWNTDKFKPYYWRNNNGTEMPFRLRFPNGYSPNDRTKKYPVIVFYHGDGEIGPVTDNDFQLRHGAQLFEGMINDGKYNAFLLFPQESMHGWHESYYLSVASVLDSMEKYCNIDMDRVIQMGLSIGGNAALRFSYTYPEKSATIISSSPARLDFIKGQDPFIHIPVWVASGGLDNNPDSASVQKFVDSFTNKGGDIRWSYYPTLGHGTWYPQWYEPYLVPYWNAAHKANPLIFYKRNQTCSDFIETKLGITAGFYAYEWQRNGANIATSTGGSINISDPSSVKAFTGNEITIKAFGTYRVRFKRSVSSEWSIFSPNPAVISPNQTIVTPPIRITGVRSKVLPAPDGSTTVPLELPAGNSYEWRNASNVVVSTERTFVAPVGTYSAVIKVNSTCTTQPSFFKVVDANGSPKPGAAENLTVVRLSASSLLLNWLEKGNPESPETGYEIYRSTVPGGPYSLISITPPNAVSYTDENLPANVNYFYVIRAVNETGAAPLSNQASAMAPDLIAPTAPVNLRVTAIGVTSIDLAWNSSTDNVGVTRYDVYVDGLNRYSTTVPSITADNLSANTSYTFTVKASDASGNTSPFSNPVTARTRADVSPPTIPLNLRVVTTGMTSIDLDWDDSIDSIGVTGYEVYVDGVKKYNSVFSNISATGLAPNTSYTFTIKAADGAGNISGFSNPATGKTLADIIAPTIPINLRVVAAGVTSVDLDWDDSVDSIGVTGYDVYVDGVKRYSSSVSNISAAGLAPNTSYTFTVTASDAAGNTSGSSNPVTAKTLADTAAPTVPLNLRVLATGLTSIDLDWDDSRDSIGVSGYDVYVEGVKRYSSTVSNVSAFGLAPNTSYTFMVKAADAAGNTSAFSNPVAAKTLPDTTAPTTPLNLRVVASTVSSIDLDWDDATDSIGVSGYDIYVDGVKKYASTVSTISATGLAPNTSYTFTVKAADAAGNTSAFSNPVTGQTLADITAPTIPVNLRVVATGVISVDLDWDDSQDNIGVGGYDVYVDGVKKYTTSVSNISAGGLAPNTTYSFTVTAADAAGNISGFSNPVTARTVADTSAPTVPLNLRVVAAGLTSIDLDWDDAADNVGVNGYDVYVDGVKKYASAVSNIRATGLAPNTSYTFTVKAADAAGNTSAFSNPATAKTIADITAPTIPLNLRVVTAGLTSIDLDWDDSIDSIGVNGYDVYVDGVKKYASTVSNISAISLAPNTSYIFTVKAADAAGNISPFSNAVTGKTLPDTTAPTTPLNLRVVSASLTSIDLDWDDSGDNIGVSGYDVYVDGVKKYSSAVSNISATSLTPNTSYIFTIKAADAAGNNSGFSNAVTGKTLPDTAAPTIPINLRVVATGLTSIALAWDDSRDNIGVTRYDVYVNGVRKHLTPVSNVVADNLTPNTIYTFTVRAADTAGNISAFSNILLAKTLPDTTAPTIPMNLKVVAVNITSVELDWDNSTDNIGVTRYDVYVNGIKKYSTTESHIEADSLTASTTYTFTVKAADFAGNMSGFSNNVTATTLGEKLLLYPNPATDVINFRWSSEYKGNARLTLLDASGRMLLLMDIKKEKEVYLDRITVSALKSAIYYINIRMQNGKSSTTSFLKKPM